METYALIKENGVTRRVFISDIQNIVNVYTHTTMLSIIDNIINKYGDYYIVKPSDIDKFSEGICSGFANVLLRKFINFQKFNYNENIYDKLSAHELRNSVLECPVDVVINNNNFDYALKELGEIKIDDSNINEVELHKCGHCRNLSPLLCEKVEYIKKPISDYDFIVDGYQIYIVENGLEYLDKFIIQKCHNFKVECPQVLYYEKPKTKVKSK